MGWFWFLFVINFLLFDFPSYTSSLVPSCNHDEASALLRFKNSFSLNSSNKYSTWCEIEQSFYPKTESWKNGTNCCLWDGVSCDTKSGHIIGLDLSCSWLRGKLHPNTTLSQLTHLHTLNLAFNDFLESPMPSGFGDLVTLKHLNLSFSRFSGVIPSKISHLSKLLTLDLSYSHGMIFKPSTFEKLIVNVTDLRDLVLDSLNMPFISPKSLYLLANFSSSLVSLSLTDTGMQGKLQSNIFCLPNLQKLYLSWNDNLYGELPKFNWSTPLKRLDLSFTAFSGKVPDSITHLKSLTYLNFRYCNFEGPILQLLSNLTQLEFLYLGRNKFSNEIPLSLSNLQNLIYLDLSGFNFEGPIPPCLGNITQLQVLNLCSNNFSGEIPSLLFNLRNLISLYLSENNFGGEIPDLFGKLAILEYLDLSQNNLVGQLPSSLFGLTQLYVLVCPDNKLVGPIPDKISELSNLKYLVLSNNLLNGTIPSWCFNLSSLYQLSLGGNQLSGPIGEFSSFSLRYCVLSFNKLQGNVPKSIFDLQNLTYLSLSSNNLSGPVDFHKFSKLQYLQSLDLSNNYFLSLNFDSGGNYTFVNLNSLHLSSCNIHSFPKFLNRLQNLYSLDLSNNQIHGSIPQWFKSTGKDTLLYLDLSHNHLKSVGHLSLSRTNIGYIDLSFNMLEGDIPVPPFGTLFFAVSNNKLSGDISSAICNASSLVILNLSHNNLIGKLPQCLGNFPYLVVLDLQRNNLSGIIPTTYFEIEALETINFNGNQLKGPLPRVVAKCKHLRVLDLGENNIQDTFPNWLEALQELQVLVLRGNKFNGTINCLQAKNTFPMLRIFDISNNSFSGTLPMAYIKNFKGMVMNVNDGLHYMKSNSTRGYSRSYNDSVAVTIKGNIFELERILTTFATIDLSNNKFEGVIPTVIEELKSLKGLNLSHNRITGFIPQSFGHLENLEWLDLSSNMLTGEIPVALTNLYSLSFLNLSQNHLEGKIPTGKQFNTFQNDSYQGNPGLCGLPLSKSCHKDEEHRRDSSIFQHEEFEFSWKVVAIGYACGVVFGILLGSIVCLIGKPQWLIWLVEDIVNEIVRKKRYKSNANRRGQC